MDQPDQSIDAQLREVIAHFPAIRMAILFGSLASGCQRADSDVDLAVSAGRPLNVAENIFLINALAESTGRPIDLIDLCTAGEALLGQVLRHGRRILGSDTAYGDLIRRHVIEQTDFMPYRNRILEERRMAWIGK